MKILIGPLSLPELISMDAGGLENPGIGGSEFHSLVLASTLRQKHDVTVWVENGRLEMQGVRVVLLPDDKDFYDLQIAFTSKVDKTILESCPLIAISHHPFDSHILDLPKRTRIVVNVGAYQLLTNQVYADKVRAPQIWLPIFFGEPRSDQLKRSGEFLVGHLSSLHPSKGFHDVLAGWMKYVTLGGTGTLQVIGGQSLYGLTESHNVLPTSKAYGERLMRLMGGKLHPTVQFLGRVKGVGGHVANWHVAVLNPKAFGESVNISLADCWREGAPVIAGNRFGQRDSMRLMPELSASSPRRISELLFRLKNSPELLEKYQNMSISAYKAIYQRGMDSKERWVDFVSSLDVYPDRLLPAGLDVEKLTASVRAQILFDGLMVRAQRAVSKILSLFRSS